MTAGEALSGRFYIIFIYSFPLYASEVATLAMTEKEKGDII